MYIWTCCGLMHHGSIAESSYCYNWPASGEKGPSDITNSVDPDQPLRAFENRYT